MPVGIELDITDGQSTLPVELVLAAGGSVYILTLEIGSVTIQSKQYVTFQIGQEKYGVIVSRTREILDLVPITKIPQVAREMLGVINLRGQSVPVVDMQLRLGLSGSSNNDTRCIIVVEVTVGEELLTVGLLVDGVREVLELSDDLIEPPPRLMKHMDSRFISGMGKVDQEFVILLDIDSIFRDAELESMQCTTESPDAQPDMLLEA